jgi:hypothetical protein
MRDFLRKKVEKLSHVSWRSMRQVSPLHRALKFNQTVGTFFSAELNTACGSSAFVLAGTEMLLS